MPKENGSSPTVAKAYPRKHFFYEMFTRDISLEDCILDLIDNSIDGLIRDRQINFTSSILSLDRAKQSKPKGKLASITIKFSEKQFRVEDTCGGIDRTLAVEEIFNFGHTAGETGGALGVYGIGLKRAIFKLGNHFQMESRTSKDGFSVDLPDVRAWSQKDETLEDWTIPITPISKAQSKEIAGTTIVITALRREVIMRLNDGMLAKRLHSTISQTYGLFLDRYVKIILNGVPVEPFEIPIGESDKVHSAREEFQEGDVTVYLFASLAARDQRKEWPAERAGWYALCNGRVVVAADKTELTGWGVQGAPVWHMGKFRGFVGVVFFESSNALALPWTTTKRGLNRESPVYQRARNMMRGVAKPVINFLDSMYKPDPTEEGTARAVADDVKPVSLAAVAAKPIAPFRVTVSSRRVPRNTVTVQYEATRADLDRVRRHLKKPGMAAARIGEFTFNHYLKTECPE